MLAAYLSDTALYLDDPSNQFYSQSTLTTHINRARRWIAARSLCVSVLVSSIDTVQNQETYALSLATSAVQAVAGVQAPFGLIGVSSSQGNYKPALGKDDFPWFQAQRRIMDGTFENYPWKFAVLGRGSLATIYLFPVPASAQPMDWITVCEPINLASDSDPEAIPYPWQDIVPFDAARLAYISQRRYADAAAMKQTVDQMMVEASRAEAPISISEYYGGQPR